jgi:hypothetical protein
MRRAVVVVAFLAVTAGCQKVRYRTPLPQPERPATAVAASFEQTWNAVIDVFARNNTPIQTLEKASGFIVAERAVIPSTSVIDYDFALSLADCGAVLHPSLRQWREYPPTAAKYNIVVRPKADGSSTVRVTAKFVSVISAVPLTIFSGSRECESKGRYERETEAAIKRAAEDSDSPPSERPQNVPTPTPNAPTSTSEQTNTRRLNVTLRMRFVGPDSTVTPIPDFDVGTLEADLRTENAPQYAGELLHVSARFNAACERGQVC